MLIIDADFPDSEDRTLHELLISSSSEQKGYKIRNILFVV